MKFIRWILLPMLIVGLRLPTYTPLELFHQYSMQPVLPYILHSAKIFGKGRGELGRLLRHQTLPFDWFYEDSCRSLMDSERFQYLLSLSKEGDMKVLLSMKCLDDLQFSLSNWELFELGPKHFFDRASENPPAFHANDHAFFELLKSYKHPSGLVQNCSWLTSNLVHDRLFRAQAYEHIGRADTWRMFHHSCFFSGRTSNSDFDRMYVLVFWLGDEVSMSQFIELKPRSKLKWVVHLLLILKRIEIEYEGGAVYLVLPLTEYLNRLVNFMSSNSIMRSLIRFCCHNWFRIDPNLEEAKLPDLGKVLQTLKRENGGHEENIRWTLTVLELYHMVSGKDIWSNQQNTRLLRKNMKVASPIEQRHWINIYLQDPKRLNFLEDTLVQLINQSTDLQSCIMTKSKRVDPPELRRLILGGVPFKARLKETRARYFKPPNRHAGRLSRLSRIVLNRPENLPTPAFDMEQAILSFISELGPYVTFDPRTGEYKIALLSPSRMGSFAFIMSTAKLFGLPLVYFDLGKDQQRLIFGGQQISLPDIEDHFDHFEIPGRPASDMLRITQCKIIRHQNQFPEETNCGEACSHCNVIYMEDIMDRLSKAVNSATEVFGQLIDYQELE